MEFKFHWNLFNWIEFQFNWIQLKTKKIHIGWEGIKNLLVNMVLKNK
jgi:hypothetical protein